MKNSMQNYKYFLKHAIKHIIYIVFLTFIKYSILQYSYFNINLNISKISNCGLFSK